jgi:hypothetical protein
LIYFTINGSKNGVKYDSQTANPMSVCWFY